MIISNISFNLIVKLQASLTKSKENDNEVFGSDILGPDYFDALPKRMLQIITEDELVKIRGFMKSVVRPPWYAKPPSNLGEASHGLLKADELRSLIDFDLPVALSRLWDRNDERMKLFHAAITLGTAIRYATSSKITDFHIQQYHALMLRFLHLVREIDPSWNLKPNNHNSLHLEDYLALYGPMHGWWMFFYERINGYLQNINTNFKAGK